MKRRAFIIGAGSIFLREFEAAAQPAVPVIGFLRSTPAGPFAHLAAAFRAGLLEMNFVDGRNVAIEYRYADNQLDRLPGLATDLVGRGVAVIVGNQLAVEAAKAVTTTIPIVFVTGDDPVQRGLVASLNRPGGNLTGLTFFGGGQLGAKRLELLRELVPGATTIGYLMDPNWPGSVADMPNVEAAARLLGRKLVVARAASESDFEPAFQSLVRAGAGALMVSGTPFFTSQRRQLVGIAARHAIPAIYDLRDHVDGGGLMSYGGSFTDAYRLAGVYAGRILQGAKPSDLPVQQPTAVELIVNLRTARALGLAVPESILARADEVIE